MLSPVVALESASRLLLFLNKDILSGKGLIQSRGYHTYGPLAMIADLGDGGSEHEPCNSW